MIGLWLKGLIAHRTARVAGTTLGIALAVALILSLGAFLTSSSLSMTARAAAAVPIDWQVELVPSADANAVRDAIGKAARVKALHTVHFAQSDGFVAATGSTTQMTGPGKVIAFDANYLKDFPREVRLLTGTLDGVLVAQQTAANLHVAPGDRVTIKRVGLSPVEVAIAGVVDLPDADALFQAVGLPKQAAPQAPPDNVLILPEARWQSLFGPQQQMRPDLVRTQFHVRLDRAQLPTSPNDAYTFVTGAERNLEARMAGQALIDDNLAARLQAVRADALYARVLFLFLGVPGIALAAIMTFAVTSTSAFERRRERALLRLRGASQRQVLAVAASEAGISGTAGVILGGLIAVGLAAVEGRSTGVISDPSVVILSCMLALALAFLSLMLPAIGERGTTTVSASRAFVPNRMAPLWQRLYVDLALLALAGLFFWQSASTGYQLVLAPEGVAATAVDYKAFISPALLWTGSMLLALRLAGLFARSGGKALCRIITPFTGTLAPAVAGSMSRQSRRLALGAAMLALAVSFAVSTSIFNTTFNAQSHVDAELTNGSDVTVFGTTENPAGKHLAELKSLPGTAAAVAMQHRFAYVGADLQDLYGIDPANITHATRLVDAYFAGEPASHLLEKLAATPDGVLVSQETVRDFQLTPGDTLNLRLMDMTDHQYHTVPFRFIGIAHEFPTAPKDSFLVANAAYIAKTTHSDASAYVLMKAKGDPAALARQADALLSAAPALKVKDINQVTQIIGSNLTAVDLKGLTGIELIFAAIMATAASGLLLLLGLIERRGVFAVLNVIGARPGQLAAFIWSEGLYVLTSGLLFGGLAGIVTAQMLVKLLTGVFDPPPDALAWPAAYLAIITAFVITSAAIALQFASIRASRAQSALLREL